MLTKVNGCGIIIGHREKTAQKRTLKIKQRQRKERIGPDNFDEKSLSKFKDKFRQKR